MNKLAIIWTGLFLLAWMPALGQPQIMPIPNPLVYSVEAEAQLGRGGAPMGLMLKANHRFRPKQRLVMRAGMSWTGFLGLRRVDEPQTEIRETALETHLRAHADFGGYLLKKGRLFLNAGLYVGGFHSYTKGSLVQRQVGIDRTFRNSEWLWDIGTRLTAGYRIDSNWELQLSATNSWRQAGYGLGLGVALLGGEPDGKSSFGLGVTYRFKTKKKSFINDL